MARDPRKTSAYESGMRGAEKPKVQSGNTGGDRGGRGPAGSPGSESSQGAGKTVGTPNGVDQSAYMSGMRGMEKPKQKSPAAATDHPSGGGGEHKQGPNTVVGEPGGHNDAGTGARAGVSAATARSRGQDAYGLGIPGNNTELSAAGADPGSEPIMGEEDDTHINIRVPKASLKKKAAGLQGN